MESGQLAGTRRRRRTPEAAQEEIIAAAEGLLRERPFRELTVDEVMRRTGLSRPSFYVYFRDRHELVLRVVARLSDDLFVVTNRWFESTGPDRARDALSGLVEVYGEHGPVLRALADAAAYDTGVEEAYTAMIESFVDVTERQIQDEVRAGNIAVDTDARQLAKALVWMSERYLYLSLGAEPRTPQPVVNETLQCIWLRTLYGDTGEQQATAGRRNGLQRLAPGV